MVLHLCFIFVFDREANEICGEGKHICYARERLKLHWKRVALI